MNLVEHKIEHLLIERAIYLSEERVIQRLIEQIGAYHLPKDCEKRLQHLLQ
jgi:hypothetical protein